MLLDSYWAWGPPLSFTFFVPITAQKSSLATRSSSVTLVESDSPGKVWGKGFDSVCFATCYEKMRFIVNGRQTVDFYFYGSCRGGVFNGFFFFFRLKILQLIFFLII